MPVQQPQTQTTTGTITNTKLAIATVALLAAGSLAFAAAPLSYTPKGDACSNSITLQKQCSKNGYGHATIVCLDGTQVTQKSDNKCLTVKDWDKYAKQACKQKCSMPEEQGTGGSTAVETVSQPVVETQVVETTSQQTNQTWGVSMSIEPRHSQDPTLVSRLVVDPVENAALYQYHFKQGEAKDNTSINDCEVIPSSMIINYPNGALSGKERYAGQANSTILPSRLSFLQNWMPVISVVDPVGTDDFDAPIYYLSTYLDPENVSSYAGGKYNFNQGVDLMNEPGDARFSRYNAKYNASSPDSPFNHLFVPVMAGRDAWYHIVVTALKTDQQELKRSETLTYYISAEGELYYLKSNGNGYYVENSLGNQIPCTATHTYIIDPQWPL